MHQRINPSKVEQEFTAALEAGGLAFQKQAQVGGWVVDVCFPDARLVVEFDGDYWHSLPAMIRRDERKDADLRAAGFRILRIRESDWQRDGADVVERVRHEVERKVLALAS